MEPKIPPSDKQAEAAVLGCALRDRVALADLLATLTVDDFYHFAHRQLWEAFSYLARAGKPVDSVTIFDRLREMDAIADLGGPAYIAEIWDSAPVIGNHIEYAKIVKGLAIRRNLISAAESIIKKAYDPSLETNEAIEDAEREIFHVTQRSYANNEIVNMPQGLANALNMLDGRTRRHAGDDDDDFLPTGFLDLDKQTGGLQRKELTIVAARPSVGKTLFALNVIDHLLGLDKRVFFASIEQGHEELILRILNRHTKIDSYCFRIGKISPEQRDRIHAAREQLKDYRLFVDDCGIQSTARIFSQARRLAMQNPPDLIVVDYLGMLEPEDRRAQRYLQLGTDCRR